MGSFSKVMIGNSEGRTWLKTMGSDYSGNLLTARGFENDETAPNIAMVERIRARNVFHMIKGNRDAFQGMLSELNKDWINMDELLPLEKGRPFNLNALLRIEPRSELEHKTFVRLLSRTIDQRWQEGAFHLSLSAEPDLSIFDQIPEQPYEHMTARVVPGAVVGGLGKLHVRFPAGEREAIRRHVHPGARIVAVVSGEGEFSAHRLVEKPEECHTTLQPGAVILMPGNTPHNFVAGDHEDMHVISIHVGYEDINSPAAMTYIPAPKLCPDY